MRCNCMCPAGWSHCTVVPSFRTGVRSLHETVFSWGYSQLGVINKLLSSNEPACRTVLIREGVACWRRHPAHCWCTSSSHLKWCWCILVEICVKTSIFWFHVRRFQLFLQCLVFRVNSVLRSIPPTQWCCKAYGGVQNLLYKWNITCAVRICWSLTIASFMYSWNGLVSALIEVSCTQLAFHFLATVC